MFSNVSFMLLSLDTHLFSQENLNDLVRDLKLSKHHAEILSSRLKERNLLKDTVRICKYRTRNGDLKLFFSEKNGLAFCNDVCSLMKVLGQEHQSDQ